MTAEQPPLARMTDPVPRVAVVKLQIHFADGQWAFFEVAHPSDTEVKLDRAPYDRLMAKFYAPTPDLIDALAVTAGEITGITLKIKAGLDSRARFLNSRGTER